MKVEIGPYHDNFEMDEKRTIDVEIHEYDVWNLDSTLALVIVPALTKLKEVKHGSPNVDDEDVPEELRSTSAPPKENEWDTDDNFFKRWDWVLDEMIWAFTQVNADWESQYHSGTSDIKFVKLEDSGNYTMQRGPNDTHKFDKEGHKAHFKRMNNGTKLFGKYYFGLWD